MGAQLELEGSPSASDDQVLELLRTARALLGARAAGAQPQKWGSALQHIDACITTIEVEEADEEAKVEEAEQEGEGSSLPSKNCCSQETQTFTSPCHSTGTQANPSTASASTGTGPRPVALGARENRS